MTDAAQEAKQKAPGSEAGPQLRYQYSGSYVDPNRFHFGCSGWITAEECRAEAAAMLRDKAIRADSIRIIEQEKKSRWVPRRNGSVEEMFPDLWKEAQREREVRAILNDVTLSARVRFELEHALQRGVAAALSDARQLVAALERIEEINARMSSFAGRRCPRQVDQ